MHAEGRNVAHPINDLLQAPDANAIRTRGESTTSIASSTISRRGTYSVTVHKRQQHTPPYSQKPHSGSIDDASVNEHVSDELQTKEVSSHLLELRSHPSVASLLSMYDDHGRIPDEAFSNSLPSPEKRERPQTRRNGSTLRELLGETAGLSSRMDNGAGSIEGDISWAERYLGCVHYLLHCLMYLLLTVRATADRLLHPPSTFLLPLPLVATRTMTFHLGRTMNTL